jgi:acetyltransferase-like isoleucine patch superfamily enzyme
MTTSGGKYRLITMGHLREKLMCRLRKTVIFAAGRMRGRPIEIDGNLGLRDILGIIYKNGIALIRGVIRLRKMVILGKNVELNGRNKLKLGRGVVVRDYSKLSCAGAEGIQFGDSVSIGAFSILSVSGSIADLGAGIRIGNNVGVGEFAHIGGAGLVTIGDDTIIGAYFSVHPENHRFQDLDILIRHQGVTRQGITVGTNCWIGTKVSILDGAKVGDGCVIAAGAVVKGTFADNSIIAGVPAKVIGIRDAKD